MTNWVKISARDGRWPFSHFPSGSQVWRVDEEEWSDFDAHGNQVANQDATSAWWTCEDEMTIRYPEPFKLKAFDIIDDGTKSAVLFPTEIGDAEFTARWISEGGFSDHYAFASTVGGRGPFVSSSKGRFVRSIVSVRRAINIDGVIDNLACETLDPKEYPIVWSAKTITKVKVGDYTAEVVDGKFTCGGATGTSDDVRKALAITTEPRHPGLQAWDVIRIGNRWGIVMLVNYKYQIAKFVVGYFKMDDGNEVIGKPDGFDVAADNVPARVDAIYRARSGNTSEVALWAFFRAPASRKLNEVTTKFWEAPEKEDVNFGKYKVTRRFDGSGVNVGCQTVKKEQLEELLAALEKSEKE